MKRKRYGEDQIIRILKKALPCHLKRVQVKC